MKKEDIRHMGMGVLLNMMRSNRVTVEAIEAAIDHVIEDVYLTDDFLSIQFADFSLRIWDDGQSCCEHRYMSSDDDLKYYIGSKFTGAEIRDAPNMDDVYDVHEVQFLIVNTDKGDFTVETHNEHNGYYGGFYIKAKLTKT